MIFLDLFDYALAFGQGLFAILLWHQAEPRMRQARGPWQAWCTMALGFVLALNCPLAFSRPLEIADSVHWWRTARDAALLLYAVCLYRRAIVLGRGLAVTRWAHFGG